MFKILTLPDPILRKIAAPVELFDETVADLIEQMMDTLTNNPRQGIGLSAPQVGVSLKVILAKDGRGEKSQTHVLINPEIINLSPVTEEGYEGCLSIPDTYCKVERSKKIVVKAQNRRGKKITIKAVNLFARVVQHEIDHLEGILIIDKARGKILNGREYDEKEKSAEGRISLN